jgi:hypothetical protein
MAKLERPLYGSEATGTFARVLAFRKTTTFGSVAKIPINTCPASPLQAAQRTRYAAASRAWHALSNDDRNFYITNHPIGLTGFNFFLRLNMLPGLDYLGYCIFGIGVYQLAPGLDQPVEAEYYVLFPTAPDELPTMVDGRDSPQAWLYNRAADALTNIQNFIILNKNNIEGG